MEKITWKNERRKVKDLIPADYNPRIITDREREYLMRSIQENGEVETVIINTDNTIIGGHQRVSIYAELGIEEIDVRVPSRELSVDEEMKLNLALNKTGGQFDIDKLREIDVAVLESVGWESKEIDKIIASDKKHIEEDEDAIVAPEVPKTKRGVIYQVGPHRLMCGDSTNQEDLAKLMDGKVADVCFTDPPYALFGNSTGVHGVNDDTMVVPFFRMALAAIRGNVKPFGHVYVCCDWHSYASISRTASEVRLVGKNLIVWDKGSGGIGNMYQMAHEFIAFFTNDPEANKTIGAKSGQRVVTGKSNIWRYPRTKDREHNAAKPLAMVADAIENSSDRGELVLDLFGGSGTTLIAAEKTGRVCHMMEMEPKWCDVIIERWKRETGVEPVIL